MFVDKCGGFQTQEWFLDSLKWEIWMGKQTSELCLIEMREFKKDFAERMAIYEINLDNRVASFN